MIFEDVLIKFKFKNGRKTYFSLYNLAPVSIFDFNVFGHFTFGIYIFFKYTKKKSRNKKESGSLMVYFCKVYHR